MGGGASLEEIYPWGWALRFYSQVSLPGHTHCHGFLPGFFFLGGAGISHSGQQGSLCETREGSLRKASKLRIDKKLKRNTEHRERMDQDLTKSLENQKKGLEKSSEGGCEGKPEPDATAVGMWESW